MDGQVSPNYMRGSVHAVQSTYYINGDTYFPGKRVLFNSKRNPNLQSYLDHLTDTIKPSFGAVRCIYTPDCGHRVASVNDLIPDKKYVVGGYEKFRPYSYSEIQTSPKKRSNKQNDYYVEPVYHTNKYRSSGRIKHIKREGKIIKCWANKDYVSEPRTILLTSWMQEDMQVIKDAITERLSNKITSAVAKLYTREGVQVIDPKQIEHGGYYIAVPHTEKFSNSHRGYKEHGAKNLMTTPRLDTKYLPPLTESQKSSKFSTPDHSHPASSHAGSENSNATSYAQRHRRNQRRKEDDGVFHAKPVAHKRSSDKVKKVDYDKDEGGVFKAKGQNRSTRGAQEVEESNETKVELPVDQREAEEVTEEKTDTARSPNTNNNNSRSHLPSQRNNNRSQSQQRNNARDRSKNRYGNNNKMAAKHDNNDDDQQDKESAAAVKIQAHIRGHQTRKQLTGISNSGSHDNQQNGYPSRTPTPPQQPKPQQGSTRNNRTASKPVTKPTRHNPKPASTNNHSDKKQQDKKQSTPPPKNGPSRNSRSQKTPAAEQKHKQYSDREEKAVTTIQAGYRGYKTRRDLKNRKKDQEPTPSIEDELKKEEELAATKIQANFRGHKVRKELDKAEKEVEKEADGINRAKEEMEKEYSEKQEQAAVKIQSTYRGFKVRKDLAEQESNDFYTEQEHNAAVKIQSGYRGYRTRRDLATQKASEYTRAPNSKSPNNYASKTYSQAEEQAAIKIQTGARGILARKELARRQAQKLYQDTEHTAMQLYSGET